MNDLDKSFFSIDDRWFWNELIVLFSEEIVPIPVLYVLLCMSLMYSMAPRVLHLQMFLLNELSLF